MRIRALYVNLTTSVAIKSENILIALQIEDQLENLISCRLWKLHFFSLIENLRSFIIRQCHICQYIYICKRRRIPCNSQLFTAERNVWETDIESYLFHVFLLPSFHPPFSHSQCPSAPLTRASYHPPSVLCRGHRVIRPSVAPRLTLSALDRKSMFFSSQLRSIAVRNYSAWSFPLCDRMEKWIMYRFSN